MELGLRDKVCLVTGSTGGIGLVVAQQLRAEGAVVVSTGRRVEGPGDVHLVADLARPGEPERVVAAAESQLGRVDCLVNNVGGTEIRALGELTDADWQASFELNLMSAIRATRAALPGMRERGAGTIVNVSSTSGKRPSREHAGLFGDEGRAALVLAPRRRRARGRRHPLQRGYARPDGNGGVDSARAASQSSKASATRCSRRSAPAVRSAGSRSRTRSRR